MNPNRIFVAAALSAALSAPAFAQENYEIQVYGAETAAPRTTLFELHSNFTGSGSRFLNGTVLPTNHAIHETLEITHGFSDIFELGFYIFTSENQGQGAQFVGTHIRPRIRAPESWKLPVGLSLSTEFGPVDKKYDAAEWGIELRPIIDQDIGSFYWAFNPTIGWALKGVDAGKGAKGMSFEPAVKLAWKPIEKYSVGVEYYGTTGSLSAMAPAAEQSHILYPTVDLFLSPDWEVNVGYGIKMSGEGDYNILKVIIGRRFNF